MKRIFLILPFLVLGQILPMTAQSPISLESIWLEYEFWANSVPGFNFLNDGSHYSRKEGDQIIRYDLLSGSQTDVLFEATQLEGQAGFNGKFSGYTFSTDESKLLIESESESIYRRSSKANFFVWDGKKLDLLFDEGKQQYATFNPAANKVAFVYENNLYYKDLISGAIVQITADGAMNQIINGAADWVYEEEFSFAKAFFWSPDGQKLAYYRFDESQVKEFTLTNYNDELYPEYVTFKYPKVGEANSLVTIHIYDLNTKKSVSVDIGNETDQYIPRLKWTKDPNKLCVFQMNRHQNQLNLLLADVKTGKTRRLLQETSDWYIDIHDNLTFLKDGKHFVWTSEDDGFNHIYLYGMDGILKSQITTGNWEVSSFYGIDETQNKIYFQAAIESPLQRDIYSIDLFGRDSPKKLNTESGWNNAQFSSTFDYYVLNHSTANNPSSYAVYDRSGKEVRLIEDNALLKEKMEFYGVQPVEFFDFTTTEDVRLNGYMIKPPDFDQTKEYPVFMYLYGGPGSQQVTDRWGGQNYWWFQMLAQQGFIVACVDNRGTGGRGEEFKKMTYLELGKYETIDQIEAARYLGGLPYVDSNRIGIFGWSYGGYMSTLCLLKGNDAFKAAIAVAPVTSWKWYDSIYTERYMRTLEENPSGYADNSPVYFADMLEGNYLLVHGMGDDNVHFQHTAEMVNALVEANKQFDTYFYPNRNHGIYGGNTRYHLYRKMTDFLKEKLMNDFDPVGKIDP
ncbi:MAG: S9 family peptidase [Saprospiraceae bacterium]|nr:S9 family peptidase [Saprospiraceae bacterium]